MNTEDNKQMVICFKSGKQIRIPKSVAQMLYDKMAKTINGAKDYQFYTDEDDIIITMLNIKEIECIISQQNVM